MDNNKNYCDFERFINKEEGTVSSENNEKHKIGGKQEVNNKPDSDGRVHEESGDKKGRTEAQIKGKETSCG